ncbi:MAG: tetratricopeptide repeat protein, partial [Candidatus Hydrogenedentota bacterium]
EIEAKLKQEYEKQNLIYKNVIAGLKEILAEEYGKQNQFVKQTETYDWIIQNHPLYYHNGKILFLLGKSKADVTIPQEWKFILHPEKEKLFVQETTRKKLEKETQTKSKKNKNDTTKKKATQQTKKTKKVVKNQKKQEDKEKQLAQVEQDLKKSITPKLQEKVRTAIFALFEQSLEKSRTAMIESAMKTAQVAGYQDILYLIHLARARAYLKNANPTKAQAELNLANVPANTKWDFLKKVIQGGVLEFNRQGEQAFSTYYAAISQYQPEYNLNEFQPLVRRTLDYYENRAEEATRRRDYGQAINQYKVVVDLYLNLYGKKIMREEIQRRFLDTVINLDQIALKALGKDEKAVKEIKDFYNSRMDLARRYLNNAFIFGRAYLYTRMGIELHTRYEKDGISSSEKEEVLELFKTAEQDFKWGFFADPYFADSYVMLGWMYQFIDEKRETIIDPEDRTKDKDKFEDLYAKYFPGYLFEENLKLYQKSIALFKDKIHPRVLASFHLNIANNYFLLSNYVRAEENYAYVYDVYKQGKYKFENEKQEGLFLFHYGKALYFKGDYEKAVEILNEALSFYEKLAPIRGVPSQVAQENQEKREIILKYITICSDYAGKPENAISAIFRVMQEQDSVGRRKDRTLLHLELARIYYENKQYDEALNHVSIAEQQILLEPKVNPPKFPIRIKWIFGISFNMPFYQLPADYVFIGKNLLAYPIPTVNRYQYIYSMSAKIYTQKGLWPKALYYMQKLIETAKEDKSKHGQQTLLAAYMRLGNLQYQLGKMDEARASYEEARKLAEEQGDLSTRAKAHKNILTIICQKIEHEQMPLEDKLDFVRKSYE